MTVFRSSEKTPQFSIATLGWALLFTLFLLGIFYVWFGLANRYVIFLYGHVAQGITAAQPFDAITSSRYWMAGLVAGGMVLIVYTPIQWLLGVQARRRETQYTPPTWWRIWLLAAVPLAVGIPLITMNVNRPTLPPSLAAACAGSTLVGLALALWPGTWAAERPRQLVWLMGDGAGLIPVLSLLRSVELPGRGISVSVELAATMAAGALFLSVAWLGLMSILRRRSRQPGTGAGMIMIAAFTLTYLLLPLVHHLFATPPAYRYITTASNFFAFDPILQLLTFGVAAGLALATVWLRRRCSGSTNDLEVRTRRRGEKKES